MKRRVFALATFLFWTAGLVAAEPRHVILMIADGASFNTWRLTSLYEGKLGAQPYDAAGWVHYPCTTVPLNASVRPTGDDTPAPLIEYDPTRVYNAAPLGEFGFFGYGFLRESSTDSAAAITALSTGVKTYNNAINWDNSPRFTGKPLRALYEIATDAGYAAGAVTTVQFYHATPAGFGAHNIGRNDYHGICTEMLTAGRLSVVMGAGNPDYDDDHTLRTSPKYEGFTPELWKQFKNAYASSTPFFGLNIVTTADEFRSLASTPTPPSRVLGVAQVATTVQQARTRRAGGDQPFQTPLNQGVPDLATMSEGALNVLSQNRNGFVVMIEGGAVDWGAHAHNTGSIIEEMADFNAAVTKVVGIIERPGGRLNWSNTLLIVTTDHGNGLPLGPDSDRIFFQPIRDNGKGKIPSMRWNSQGHTRELVPVFARGLGAERFAGLTHGEDSRYRDVYQLDKTWPDRYIDNTDIFKLMNWVLTESRAPAR